MKVLHIIPSVSPRRGGPSKAVVEMVNALNNEGINAEIATTNDDGPEELNVLLGKRTSFANAPVYFFKRFSPSSAVLTPVREFSFSNPFRIWLKENIKRYDVVHVHAIFSFTSSYAMWLARQHSIPYVVRPIGQLESWSLQQSYWRKRIFLSLFERKNLREAALIHFTAMSERNQASDNLDEIKTQRSSTVIPLGVALPEQIDQARAKLCSHFDLAADKKIILFLSRIHPKKGLDLLIRGLNDQQDRQWQFVIAGEGDTTYVEQLNALTKELGIAQHCHFIGFQTGATKQLLLQGADVFALTSYSENFGIAVLESLAAGTPVLISNEVAMSEHITKPQLGIVCETNSQSITDALSTISGKDSRSFNSIRQVVKQHFAWSSTAKSLRAEYQKILQRQL